MLLVMKIKKSAMDSPKLGNSGNFLLGSGWKRFRGWGAAGHWVKGIL